MRNASGLIAGDRMEQQREGKVISLGQVIVDLTMKVPQVPQAGQDVFADDVETAVGASFNMLHAVRQMGIEADHAGVLGSGPWADMIRKAFAADGVRHIGKCDANRDSGFCVALTDDDAERTFISTRGAEAFGDVDAFSDIRPNDGDVVHISGYTLAHKTGSALLKFLERTAENRRFTALFDPSPVIGQIDDDVFGTLVEYRPIWSCNERESMLMAQHLGLTVPDGDFRTLAAMMTDALRSTLVMRVGGDGAWLAESGREPELIAGYPVRAVDTNGAGDCHAGVLCAELSRGVVLRDAIHFANVAAAVAVTRRGPATCPTRKEVEQLLSV